MRNFFWGSWLNYEIERSKNLLKVGLDCDLAEANSNVHHFLDTVKQRRSRNIEFSTIYASAEIVLRSLDGEIAVPRVKWK